MASRRKPRAKLALRPLDEFTRSFFQAALWSTVANATNNDNDDRSFAALGYDIDDFDPHVRNALAEECESFQEEFGDAIDADVQRSPAMPWPSNRELAGYGLWMTRNGHGVGFWDGDWPEPLSEILTDSAQRLGEVQLYVVGQRRDGKGGTIYASGYEKPRTPRVRRDPDDDPESDERLRAFAKAVIERLSQLPSNSPYRFGRYKVFLAALPLDRHIRRMLVEAHQKGYLRLARADLVPAMTRALVRESEVRGPVVGEWHFLNLE